MNEDDPRPIVLGLYCHAHPEQDTLRRLLNWLRDQSFLDSVINSQSSIEDSKQFVRDFYLHQALTNTCTPGRLTSEALAILQEIANASAPPRLDEALIEQVVQSNGVLPKRVRLRCFALPSCPVEIGYADEIPDDFREDGRRFIQISASSADWADYWQTQPPERTRAQRLTQLCGELAGLAGQCSERQRLTYAAIRQDRPLPTPRTLLTTTDPRDFDWLFLPVRALEADVLIKEYDEVAGWSLTRVEPRDLVSVEKPRGVLIRFHGNAESLSPEGRRLMDVWRDILKLRLEGLGG